MLSNHSANPPTFHPLYHHIQAAIRQTKSSTGHKPSLVQINRQDYEKLIGGARAKSNLGLSIDNVTVASFADVEEGRFYFCRRQIVICR